MSNGNSISHIIKELMDDKKMTEEALNIAIKAIAQIEQIASNAKKQIDQMVLPPTP